MRDGVAARDAAGLLPAAMQGKRWTTLGKFVALSQSFFSAC